MIPRATQLIAHLGLRPHPEGGHFVETFRSASVLAVHGGTRAASTAIYFLLTAAEVSRWHRVRSDEVWHWYEGAPLELLICAQPGAAVARHRLGPVASGQQPQFTVPADCWQAARPLGDYTLVGCTVAPGFDFADFTLIERTSTDGAWFRTQADPRLVDG